MAVDEGRVRRQGIAAVRHGGQNFVVDVDEGDGVFRDVAGVRHDDGHDFADETDLVFGENNSLRGLGELQRRVVRGYVVARQQRRDIRIRKDRVHTW